MTAEQLQDNILACLGNNSYFDAALAAIGTVLLQAAKDMDPSLSNPDNYQVKPVPTGNIRVRKKQAAAMDIGYMPGCAQAMALNIRDTLTEILADDTQRVLWNTVRVAFLPRTAFNVEYNIWLVYMTCPNGDKV